MNDQSLNGIQSNVYRRRWWILGILSMSLLIIGLDNTILNVAIPTLQREFSASATSLQWMVDAYILVFAGLLLTMGSLGDRFGRKRALQVGLVIFGLSSLFAAYADSSAQLITARALMGIGGALIMPSTLSILTDVFPREERGKAIGIWAGVAGLGVGIGPLTGGVLLENFWWGSVFLINIPVVVIAIVTGLILVPESRDPQPKRLDIPGALLSITAISTLVYFIIEAPAHGWTNAFVIAGFLGGAVLTALFLIWESKIDHPMLNLAYFKNPRFSAGAGAIALGFFALFGMIFGMTQYLQFVQGFTPLEAGLRMAPIALGIAAGAGSSHRFVGKLGTNKVVAAGLVGLAVVFVTISFWQIDTNYWIVGGTFFFLAFSMGNVMAPSTDSVMGAVPEANAGVASAMNDVTRQVAGALGVAVIGSVINTVYSEKMEPAVANLPSEAAIRFGDSIGDSIGAALKIASMMPPEIAVGLIGAAKSGFTEALGIAVLAAAAMAIAAAILVLKFMPPRHLPTQQESPAETPVSPADTGASTGGTSTQ